jgi:hypothetical protein
MIKTWNANMTLWKPLCYNFFVMVFCMFSEGMFRKSRRLSQKGELFTGSHPGATKEFNSFIRSFYASVAQDDEFHASETAFGL